MFTKLFGTPGSDARFTLSKDNWARVGIGAALVVPTVAGLHVAGQVPEQAPPPAKISHVTDNFATQSTLDAKTRAIDEAIRKYVADPAQDRQRSGWDMDRANREILLGRGAGEGPQTLHLNRAADYFNDSVENTEGTFDQKMKAGMLTGMAGLGVEGLLVAAGGSLIGRARKNAAATEKNTTAPSSGS